ncbi:uncharacterized protein CPUR_02862 [Claviceps purpurea 20.1]|uniref:Uncharacterized protein n=1 Tax=Claviceps purpurea (strain 20.1) TaxID=1111077 RepID=M1W0B7_CLAP2|nr:hypothetical protein E4U12_004980 [Claviceps purpurea]CCE29171.1 uncharacterized protein CPUR_02862 [Claviceps purpurea 20.1]KAG6134139.1 hypothetical protein E4U38_002522 [Claviceps purpurea]KAG6162458.1 hypothetical protein E4U11_002650 [Claviceps purpurea]KAG6174297.1 hypothetical protein E4U51_002729 [Claviceps purpurea]
MSSSNPDPLDPLGFGLGIGNSFDQIPGQALFADPLLDLGLDPDLYLPNQGAPPVSFIFVINELHIDFDRPEARNMGKPTDSWHNVLPPRNREQYSSETPGEVLRFFNGRITRASSERAFYNWVRRDLSSEGHILCRSAAPAFFSTMYKQASVFSCNPHLPIIAAEDDILVRPETRFHALQFLHTRPNAVSQISYHFDQPRAVPVPPLVTRPGPPLKYVAGAFPSWIPSLVPHTYSNPYSNEGASGGLAGEMAVLLGLMAFHSSRSTLRGKSLNDVFLGKPGEVGGLWRDYQWFATEHPPGYPRSADDPPRGFLVYICYDPENTDGSTEKQLASLEWQGPLVLG